MDDPAPSRDKKDLGRHNWRNRPRTLSNAKRLRRNMTDAELLLWSKLRRHQIHGLMFRHQTSIGHYIVDFACLTIKLIIEVDGGQHNINKAADERRTRWLEARGYRVMRFWNNEVLQNLDGVLEVIWRATAPKSE
jgi:ATP-dependent helicase HrpA/adenine-specific DNA-methyltransferase